MWYVYHLVSGRRQTCVQDSLAWRRKELSPLLSARPSSKTYWTLRLQSPVHASLRLPVSSNRSTPPSLSSLRSIPGFSLLTLSSKVNTLLLYSSRYLLFFSTLFISIYIFISLFYIIHLTGRISQPSLPRCKSALLTISTASNPCC